MLENEIENLFKCLWTTVCFCLHHKKTKRLLRELLVNNYGDLVCNSNTELIITAGSW